MMKTISAAFSLSFLLCLACTPPPSNDLEAAKEEIRLAEKAFNDMAAEKGIREAFLYFAAPNAVMVRGSDVIGGHEEMKAHFDSQTLLNVSLTWSPDFVDVSTSGDLGYTYGKYTFSATDSTGNPISASGIFHTVWKKQADGSWKFVYD